MNKSHKVAFFSLFACYFAIQVLYILSLPIAPDEFHFLRQISELLRQSPYSEIHPYKTLLGQYFQSVVLLFVSDEWSAIFWIKLQAAFSVVLVFVWVVFYLRRFFSDKALCLSLVLLFSMSTFLERSAELRVDMLTSLVALVGFCFLLDKRILLAGFFSGLSFLVSQKGIYFCIASFVSVLAALLLFKEDRELRKKAAYFFAMLILPILVYLLYWSLFARFSFVVELVFTRHLYVVFQEFYGFLADYWLQTFVRNPFFYLLAISSLCFLLLKSRKEQLKFHEVVLFFYGSSIIFLCLLHKQSWPYFFVILIPSLFVLITHVLEIVLGRKSSKLFCLVFVVLGTLYPLSRVPHVLMRDHLFQKEMLRVSKRFLVEKETYFSGFDYLFNHNQALHSLSWLDRARLLELHSMSSEDRGKLLRSFENRLPKFILTNYRIASLPREFKALFFRYYDHSYGNIHAYSPVVGLGRSKLKIFYKGRYELRMVDRVADTTKIIIDGRSYKLGDQLVLSKGSHSFDFSSRLRLHRVLDESELGLREEFRESRKFFDRIYEY